MNKYLFRSPNLNFPFTPFRWIDVEIRQGCKGVNPQTLCQFMYAYPFGPFTQDMNPRISRYSLPSRSNPLGFDIPHAIWSAQYLWETHLTEDVRMGVSSCVNSPSEPRLDHLRLLSCPFMNFSSSIYLSVIKSNLLRNINIVTILFSFS